MESVLGRIFMDFIQDKFTEDEIKQAIARESDEYGIEVSDDSSRIRMYPKDSESVIAPVVLTVEHHVKWPKDKCWHMELLNPFGDDPHNDPKNHARWVGIPFRVFLDKVAASLVDSKYMDKETLRRINGYLGM